MRTSKIGRQPLDSISHVNWMLSSTLFRWFNRLCTLSLGTTVQVSSTNHFQKGSWMSNVLRARPSTSSMAKFATATHTGDPMAVPNTCLYVAVRQNSKSLVNSSGLKDVREERESLVCSLHLATSTASFTGTLVNSQKIRGSHLHE